MDNQTICDYGYDGKPPLPIAVRGGLQREISQGCLSAMVRRTRHLLDEVNVSNRTLFETHVAVKSIIDGVDGEVINGQGFHLACRHVPPGVWFAAPLCPSRVGILCVRRCFARIIKSIGSGGCTVATAEAT